MSGDKGSAPRLPDPPESPRKTRQYGWADMKVGESRLFVENAKAARQSAMRYARTHPADCAFEGRSSEGGIRVFRVR